MFVIRGQLSVGDYSRFAIGDCRGNLEAIGEEWK